MLRIFNFRVQFLHRRKNKTFHCNSQSIADNSMSRDSNSICGCYWKKFPPLRIISLISTVVTPLIVSDRFKSWCWLSTCSSSTCRVMRFYSGKVPSLIYRQLLWNNGHLVLSGIQVLLVINLFSNHCIWAVSRLQIEKYKTNLILFCTKTLYTEFTVIGSTSIHWLLVCHQINDLYFFPDSSLISLLIVNLTLYKLKSIYISFTLTSCGDEQSKQLLYTSDVYPSYIDLSVTPLSDFLLQFVSI